MNGGHFQYFLNRPDETEWLLAAKMARDLGQVSVAENLEKAMARWQSAVRAEPETAEEFCEEALEDEFGDTDTRFYQLESNLIAALEAAVD